MLHPLIFISGMITRRATFSLAQWLGAVKKKNFAVRAGLSPTYKFADTDNNFRAATATQPSFSNT